MWASEDDDDERGAEIEAQAGLHGNEDL